MRTTGFGTLLLAAAVVTASVASAPLLTAPLTAQRVPDAPMAPSSASESSPTVSVGDRVRISLGPSDAMLVGELTAVGSDRLVLALDDGTTVPVPVSDLIGVERGRREPNFVKHFLTTVAVSTAGGSLLAGLTWSECEGWCILNPSSRREAVGLGAAVGAVIGVSVGVLTGLSATEERWDPVGLPSDDASLADRISLEVAPTSGGLSLAASLAFGGGS